VSTPDDLTFDLTPPRRPTIDDLGGGAKIQKEPGPNPTTQLTANDVNQWAKQEAALWRVTPVAKVHVRFSGGAPIVDSVVGARTEIATSDFTPTDNGTGDTTITWGASLLPSPAMPHVAHVVGSTKAIIATESLTNSARVRTESNAGVATDAAFVLEIH
jgi:hypothetical protein